MTTGSAASPNRQTRRSRLPAFPLSRHQIIGHHPLARHSSAAAVAPGQRRRRVLVIADRARVALEVQQALATAGYRTVGPATSTDEARHLLSRFAIDCAIVDLDARCSAATDLLEQQGTPFVILTSRMDPPPTQANRPRLHTPVECGDVVAAVERAT